MTEQTHRTRTGRRHRRRSLRQLIKDNRGMAAVEFSLILPILVVLWIGGVEVTEALSVDRHLNNLASAIGDLSARSKQLTYSDVDSIFNISTGAMYPYSTTGLTMRLTAVDIDKDGNVTVAWSRAATGTTPYALTDSVDSIVPAALRQFPDSQVIMAEVAQAYTPAVGYVITGDINLSDRVFFVPRLTDHVVLCDDNGANCQS